MKEKKKGEQYEQAVLKFQKGRITKRELLRVIADLILIIPPSKGNFDDDQRSEFFAFIMGDIERILKSYRPMEKASFKTWFAKVLTRKYLYFLKRRNKDNDTFIEYESSCDMDKHYADPVSPGIEEYQPEDSMLPVFSVGEQNVIMEKYGKENPSAEFVERIVEKSRRKRIIQSRVISQYYKMIKYQRLQKAAVDSDELAQLKKKEQEIKRRKREYEKIYNSYSIFPTNEWVAQRLNISPGTVASYLDRIRKKILKYYNDNEGSIENP